MIASFRHISQQPVASRRLASHITGLRLAITILAQAAIDSRSQLISDIEAIVFSHNS